MTREEIQSLAPGRELDALMAEKVMGWTISRKKVSQNYGAVLRIVTIYDVKDGRGMKWGSTLDLDDVGLPKYSTDISAAWEVVEKIKAEMQDVMIHDDPCQGCTVTISLISVGKATTAPHAICIAALLAVMEGTDEES